MPEIRGAWRCVLVLVSLAAGTPALSAQLTDVTQAPNAANAGIKKSLLDQMGPGRGDDLTAGTSLYLIRRDPFRSIMRGRQIFQRKFTVAEGNGPRTGDGLGDIEQDGSIGAGLVDSCAGCHARPFGSAGFGGNVFTRPTSRDAPHLFGLGLQEMLADEITAELRAIRDQAVQSAQTQGTNVTLPLVGKGIGYGFVTGRPNGTADTSLAEGVDADLRVRPFFAQGGTISIREFLVGAFNAEMGLESPDPDLAAAAAGADVTTPAGMRLTGSVDAIEAPPAAHAFADPDGDGVVNEIPASIVDHLELYLLNYFKPALGEQNVQTKLGRKLFAKIGCVDCHVPNLTIDVDRRVADLETVHDPAAANGYTNQLFATAAPLFAEVDDGQGLPALKVPLGDSFVVKNIFTDFKRHDLGPLFHEENFDGTRQTQFMTEPLWGVGSTPPYGHDGRSATLRDVILRHGGAAQAQRNKFVALNAIFEDALIAFLESLVLFAPPDTASNLDPAQKSHPDFPFAGTTGSVDLSVLFVDSLDKE